MFSRDAARTTVRGLALILVIGTLGVACGGSDSDSRDRNVSSGTKVMTCSKAGQVKNVAGKKMVCGQSTMAKKSPKQWFAVAAQKKWVCKKPGIPRFQNGMLSICGTVKKKTFWHTVVQAQASALATPAVTTIAPATAPTVAASPTATTTANAVGSVSGSPIVRESGTGPAPTTSTTTTLPAPTTTGAPRPGPTTTLGALELVASYDPPQPRVGDEVWFRATAGCEVEEFRWWVDSAKFQPHSESAIHQSFRPSQPEKYKVRVLGKCDSGEFAGRELSASFDLQVLGAPRPANDDIADAEVVSGNSGSVKGTSTGATLEVGESKHTNCQFESDVSVWHRWTAPKSGRAAFTHTPQDAWRLSSFVIYSGTTFETLERVQTVTSEDWSTQTFDAVEGRAYSIASTACYRGGFGAFEMTWALTDETSTTTTAAPNTTVPAPAPTLKVGDIGPGGGIVFLTPASEGNLTGKYFEAAPATWYAPFDRGGVTATQLAASMEYGGLKDWVLPSINELRALYAMRDKASCKTKCATSFGTGTYWSSTVEEGKQPLTVNFSTQGSLAGAVTELDRTSGAFIRAIRSFS